MSPPSRPVARLEQLAQELTTSSGVPLLSVQQLLLRKDPYCPVKKKNRG